MAISLSVYILLRLMQLLAWTWLLFRLLTPAAICWQERDKLPEQSFAFPLSHDTGANKTSMVSPLWSNESKRLPLYELLASKTLTVEPRTVCMRQTTSAMYCTGRQLNPLSADFCIGSQQMNVALVLAAFQLAFAVVQLLLASHDRSSELVVRPRHFVGPLLSFSALTAITIVLASFWASWDSMWQRAGVGRPNPPDEWLSFVLWLAVVIMLNAVELISICMAQSISDKLT